MFSVSAAKRARRSARFGDGASSGFANTPGDSLAVLASVAATSAAPAPPVAGPTQKKRRNMNPLAVNAAEARYLPETSAQCYLNGSLAREDAGGRTIKMRFARARKAAKACWAVVVDEKTRDWYEYTNGKLTSTLASQRRGAIAFLYEHIHESPDESEWKGTDGTIQKISRALHIPLGSAALVRKVLEDVVRATDAGEEYDPDGNLHHGATVVLEPDGREAAIIADCQELGVSIGQTAALLNVRRAQRNAHRQLAEDHEDYCAPVSYHAVQAFIARHPGFNLHKRGTKKSGSDDPGESRVASAVDASLSHRTRARRFQVGEG